MAWHFLRSSMQIAILFIYNHCQHLNNIYLRSNFISSPPCHSSQIFHDKRQQKKCSGTESHAGEGSRVPSPEIPFSTARARFGVENWNSCSYAGGKCWRKNENFSLSLTFFAPVSVGSLGFFSRTNIFIHMEKKLANIRDDYVHCVTDE